MRLFLILILMGSAMTGAATALTLDEYSALPADEKIKVLKGKPYKVLDDPSELLRLHTISLVDESLEVQRLAVVSSIFLVQGLQSAKLTGDFFPEFPQGDSVGFQQTLIAGLRHDDPGIRVGAAVALAYTIPPNPQIEVILLERLENEKDTQLKGYIIEEAVQAGYGSERFVALVLEQMQSEDNYRKAAGALALLTPDTALDTLIEIASKESRSQQYALEVLAAYGRRAMRAKPMLEELIKDQTIRAEMRETIHKRAARTLEAITLDKPEASHRKVVKLTQLWPLALPGAETSDPQETDESSTALAEQRKIPSPIPLQQERSKPETEAGEISDPREEPGVPVWIWMGALILFMIVLWVVPEHLRKK